MPARSQTICYPTNGDTGRLRDICLKCNVNAPHTGKTCCDSSGSKNSTTYTEPCTNYCNANANTVCTSSQAYCDIGHELISSHGDVGGHPPITCTVKDEIIFRNWTASYWNSLQDNLLTADKMGKTVSSNFGFSMTPAAPDPCNNTHAPSSLVTAEKFNEIATAYRSFRGSLANVNVGDVIRGAEHAGQIVNQYPQLMFKSNVCDVCNASAQWEGSCMLSSPCPCTCNCGCDCPCDCSCGCSCSCNRPCSCPGNK